MVSGHLLFGQPYVLFVLDPMYVCHFSCSHFGFEGGTVVRIPPVTGHRLPFTLCRK